MTVLLCSCGIPAQKQECFCIPESFVCDIFITTSGKEYEGTLEREVDGKYITKLVSPESVKGMEIKCENGEYEVTFAGSKATLNAENSFVLKEATEFLEESIGKETEFTERDGKYIVEKENLRLVFDKTQEAD